MKRGGHTQLRRTGLEQHDLSRPSSLLRSRCRNELQRLTDQVIFDQRKRNHHGCINRPEEVGQGEWLALIFHLIRIIADQTGQFQIGRQSGWERGVHAEIIWVVDYSLKKKKKKQEKTTT